LERRDDIVDKEADAQLKEQIYYQRSAQKRQNMGIQVERYLDGPDAGPSAEKKKRNGSQRDSYGYPDGEVDLN
jgi:hypothetical protein